MLWRASSLAAAAFSALSCAALLSGCTDAGGEPPGKKRDEVVTASGPRQPSGSVAAAASSAPSRKGKLCTPSKSELKPKSVKMGSVQAADETPLSEEIVLGGGKWTWINIWAGWCEPCLEEIPLLKSWEKKLSDKLRVEFVSIDDDDRLALRFLTSQPAGGVRRSHHLGDPDARKEFLDSLGPSVAKMLPSQILVDPDGVVRCSVNGAVMPSDLPEVEALVAGAK